MRSLSFFSPVLVLARSAKPVVMSAAVVALLVGCSSQKTVARTVQIADLYEDPSLNVGDMIVVGGYLVELGGVMQLVTGQEAEADVACQPWDVGETVIVEQVPSMLVARTREGFGTSVIVAGRLVRRADVNYSMLSDDPLNQYPVIAATSIRRVAGGTCILGEVWTQAYDDA